MAADGSPVDSSYSLLTLGKGASVQLTAESFKKADFSNLNPPFFIKLKIDRYLKLTSSTSKTMVAFGGIGPRPDGP